MSAASDLEKGAQMMQKGTPSDMAEIRRAVDEALTRARTLDPVPSEQGMDEALEVSRREALADLDSMRDAVTHFVQSVKHLPLYTFVEKHVDGMVKSLYSAERLLHGQQPVVEIIDSVPPKVALAHLLAATYNHYHGLDEDAGRD